jgi:hypothetical protein
MGSWDYRCEPPFPALKSVLNKAPSDSDGLLGYRTDPWRISSDAVEIAVSQIKGQVPGQHSK